MQDFKKESGPDVMEESERGAICISFQGCRQIPHYGVVLRCSEKKLLVLSVFIELEVIPAADGGR